MKERKRSARFGHGLPEGLWDHLILSPPEGANARAGERAGARYSKSFGHWGFGFLV